MKQLIRSNTFETNSSSMHSLVVSKNAIQYKQEDLNFSSCIEYKNGEPFFNLYDGDVIGDVEFGRAPFQVLNNPAMKLRYWVGWYIKSDAAVERIKEAKDFICKATGVPISNIELKANPKASPDYQYMEVYPNDTGEDPMVCLEEHNVSLEEFVLDPRYTVIIDGDEYMELSKLFDAGIISPASIDYISSGIDAWLKSSKSIGIPYLTRIANSSEEFAEFISNISDYMRPHIKSIIFEETYWGEEYTHITEDGIKMIELTINTIKAKRPDMEFNLQIPSCIPASDYERIRPYISKITEEKVD